MNGRILALGLLLTTGTAAGCADTTNPGPLIETADQLSVMHADSFLFMTQNVVPSAAMDALFQGQVFADDEGCLRLDNLSDYGVTVIWPHGYEIDVAGGGEGGSVIIADETGEPVGELEGSFSLGGGEVDTLLESMGFTDADRELAEAYCPGKYWIVASD